ncbi:MAG: hypothetical protein P8Z36_12245, partial [Gemmatimonadota bacterium]
MSGPGAHGPAGPEIGTDEPGRPPTSPPPLTLIEALLPILTMLVLFVAGVVFLQLSAELLVAVLLGSAAV